MLVDTGSSLSWVAIDSCKSTQQAPCTDDSYFHYQDSATNTLSDRTKTIVYGSLVSTGSYMTDLVTSPTNSEVSGVVQMLGVTEQRSHIEESEFSGILGLAPDSESSGPLLVWQLYEKGKISANAFSIQLAP